HQRTCYNADMRMLVTALCAATCVAVLAAVGYFFYGEYAEAKARAAETARLEDVRKELFALAEAGAGEVDKVRKYCSVAETGLTVHYLRDAHDHWRQVVKNCRYFGYL